MILAVTNDEYEHIVYMEKTCLAMSKVAGVSYPTVLRQCNGKSNESMGKLKFLRIKMDDDEEQS